MGDYIDKGVTFQSGSQVTHTDLNNLVDNAVIKNESIGYHNLKNGSLAESIIGFPQLVLADISGTDYFLVWSATHNELRKVSKGDVLGSLSETGLSVSGENIIDENGKLLSTMTQPNAYMVLFEGRQFEVKANEEEGNGILKITGRLDDDSGVAVYNTYELITEHENNRFIIRPDDDNTGANPDVLIDCDLTVNGTTTSNDFKFANGNGVVAYNPDDAKPVHTIRRLTQAQYDAIATKDVNTLYILTET